jgi:hypothetical protein
MQPETAVDPQHAAVLPPSIDRRCCYRAQLLASRLEVRAWKIPPGTPLAHSPMPSQAIPIIARNIGTAGLGIILRDEAGQQLTVTDRLRIELIYDKVEVLVEGRLRTPDTLQQPFELSTGIRFDGNISNIGFHKAQSWLSSIMGLVQREEIKAKQAVEQPPAEIIAE